MDNKACVRKKKGRGMTYLKERGTMRSPRYFFLGVVPPREKQEVKSILRRPN